VSRSRGADRRGRCRESATATALGDAHPDRRAHPASLDPRVTVASMAGQASPVSQDSRSQSGPEWTLAASCAHQDPEDLQDPKASQVSQAARDCQERGAGMRSQAGQGTQDSQETQESPETPETQEPRESQDGLQLQLCRETQERQVNQDGQDPRENQGPRGTMETEDLRDHRDLKAHRDSQAGQENQAELASQGLRDHLGRMPSTALARGGSSSLLSSRRPKTGESRTTDGATTSSPTFILRCFHSCSCHSHRTLFTERSH
jgi:hypothetical protein